MPTIDALTYLSRRKSPAPAAVCVVFGDEAFLKRLALAELRKTVLSGDDSEFSFTSLAGREATLRDVVDELSTVSMFGAAQRLVQIDDADDFVVKNRAALEAYQAKPKGAGVLVLEVRTWAKNTRLYKAVDASGLQIECSAPTTGRLLKWLVSWAKQRHQTQLEPAAADSLVEIIGPELGLLDQELAKLAAYAGQGEPVTAQMVHDLVGGWRAKTTWEMLDAALNGDTPEALRQLDLLLSAGEAPVAMLGAAGYVLRRFAAATRLVEQAHVKGRRVSLRDALAEVGVRNFVLAKSEAQLRRLGRHRGGQLYRWLLQVDLGLKGASTLPPRLLMEQLIVRLSQPAPQSTRR